ncbi:MAG: hypothetical protein R3B48_03570 [Kofleriaceae bacterium]
MNLATEDRLAAVRSLSGWLHASPLISAPTATEGAAADERVPR